MPYIDDGGNFSDDLMTRLRAMQNGGSMSNQDLADSEQIPKDSVNTASGVLGSVQAPGAMSALSKLAGVGEQEAPGMAQKIQEAAANGNTKWLPTTQQAADDAIKQQYKNAPKNFFDKARAQASANGVGPSPQEQAAMAQQAATTKNIMQNRIDTQIQQARDPQFQNLKRMFGQ